MALENDLLAGISLAGIAVTAIFVFVINFLGWEDKHRSKAKEKEKEKAISNLT